MINIFSEYIKTILIFLMITAFINIILPSDKYKTYVSLLMGFILMILVINPIFNLLSKEGLSSEVLKIQEDYDKKYFENLTLDYENLQRDMVYDNFKSAIKSQISNMIIKENYEIESLEIDFVEATGEILSIYMEVKYTDKIQEEYKISTPIIRVEKININNSKNETSNKKDEELEESVQINKLKKIISDFYNLSQENIYIKEIF